MKFMTKAQRVLASKSGEGYLDTVVKIIACVVLGALLIGALAYLLNDVAFPTAKDKVESMFSKEYTYVPSVGE